MGYIGPSDIVFQPNHQFESITLDVVDTLPPIHFPNLRELQIRTIEWDMPSLQVLQLRLSRICSDLVIAMLEIDALRTTNTEHKMFTYTIVDLH